MKQLKEKILTEGIPVNEDILRVDSFINHQVDPGLMREIGKAFARTLPNISKAKALQKLPRLKVPALPRHSRPPTHWESRC